MIWVILIFFGLCAGSFISALVWRTRQQEKGKELSITKGRSQCPHCHHSLAWYDLIPLFSWLSLRGRCRYCRKPISWHYPLTELAMVAVFTISYAYWPGGVFGMGDWVLLITWIMTSVGLLALLIYDLKWMLLPNKILYPTLAVAAAGRMIYIFSFEPDKFHAVLSWALSILVASGIFLLFYTVSSGRWIGYGDVRIGLIIGTVLADPLKSLLMIFIASVLGTLVALPALLSGRRKLTSRLPFGPFLIAATMLALIFGQNLIDWYTNLLG
jgi:leader peptidase (prepilin peptidase)/N-methyltransferase